MYERAARYTMVLHLDTEVATVRFSFLIPHRCREDVTVQLQPHSTCHAGECARMHCWCACRVVYRRPTALIIDLNSRLQHVCMCACVCSGAVTSIWNASMMCCFESMLITCVQATFRTSALPPYVRVMSIIGLQAMHAGLLMSQS